MTTSPLPPLRSLPEGQEATLRALARTMFRSAAVVGGVVSVVAVVLAAVLVGTAGALSATLGVVIAVGSSLLTLLVMRRTAALAPSAVMVASLGGFLTKMIVLLLALFLLGRLDGVHRESLALTMLALFIAIAGAEAPAGYRMPTLVVDPSVAAKSPTTSGSVTGMSDSTISHPGEPDGTTVETPPRAGHEE